MSVETSDVADALAVEDWRDGVMLAALALVSLFGVAVVLSPALAGYYAARYVGMAPFPSASVGIGGYVVALAYIRFGGTTINVN